MGNTMKKMSALLIMLILGLAGISALSFYVQPVKALYSVVEIDINPDGSITPSDAPINNVGNITYTLTDDINITAHPGYYSAGIRIKRSNIIFNGNGHTLMGHGGGGIAVSGVDNVTIENTTVNGFETCIGFDDSYNNIIRGNNFSGDRIGAVVRFIWSGNNTIDGNSITNGNYGVELAYSCNNNTFTRNYIANNTFWAITLHLGAGGCNFYHNVISGPVLNDGPASTWDNGYPSGGNYWVGYVSPDLYCGPYQNITGGDGIGDNPLQVSYLPNIDHYPFMLVSICNVSQTPVGNVLPTDVVRVNATVTHLYPLEQVILNCTYTNSSATWTASINMTNLEDNVWNATIPPLPIGTNITYAIIARDNAGNSISSEAQGYEFEYPVVPEFSSLFLLPLFVLATFFVIVCKKRRLRPSI